MLSYLRGPNRWVLKCPQHLERLGPLMATFPDATWPSRSATRWRCCSRRSRCSPTATATGAARSTPTTSPPTGSIAIERLLRAAVRDAHLIPEAQRIDVEFGEFMADDLAMATRIIEQAGPGGHRRRRAAARRLRAANPRGKDGRIVYDLRADFGLDPAELYDRYAFYFDAFPQIRTEVALMPGIHRDAPGRRRHGGGHGRRAIDLGDGIWMSSGLVEQLPASAPTTAG